MREAHTGRCAARRMGRASCSKSLTYTLYRGRGGIWGQRRRRGGHGESRRSIPPWATDLRQGRPSGFRQAGQGHCRGI